MRPTLTELVPVVHDVAISVAREMGYPHTEDLSQDVLYVLHFKLQGGKQFEKESHIRAYIRGIARRIAIKDLRLGARRKQLLFDFFSSNRRVDHTQDPRGQSGIEMEALAPALRNAIQILSSREQDVVIGKLFDRTYRQIGRDLDLDESTVRQTWIRAAKQLVENLETLGFESGNKTKGNP